ncbi:MAG: hypothetical protein KAR19_12685 [Bacteroidales bacterium]|nr:hypothetical protein [Bacteroidales bacterium]
MNVAKIQKPQQIMAPNPSGLRGKHYFSASNITPQYMLELIRYFARAKSSGTISDDQFTALITLTLSNFVEAQVESKVNRVVIDRVEHVFKVL